MRSPLRYSPYSPSDPEIRQQREWHRTIRRTAWIALFLCIATACVCIMTSNAEHARRIKAEWAARSTAEIDRIIRESEDLDNRYLSYIRPHKPDPRYDDPASTRGLVLVWEP